MNAIENRSRAGDDKRQRAKAVRQFAALKHFCRSYTGPDVDALLTRRHTLHNRVKELNGCLEQLKNGADGIRQLYSSPVMQNCSITRMKAKRSAGLDIVDLQKFGST